MWCDTKFGKLTEEFNRHFLVKKSEIVSLKPEHQSETHFFKRRISVDEFGWHVVLDQRYVKKFVGCNGNESLQIDGYSWIEGTGGQQCDGETGCKGTSRVPIWCWNLSVHDRATLRHCLQHEGNHERGSWTDHSFKDKVKANRALPQRTPAMCVEFPLAGTGDLKPRCSTSGGVLAIGPCFTVRHWSVTQATVSPSSA